MTVTYSAPSRPGHRPLRGLVGMALAISTMLGAAVRAQEPMDPVRGSVARLMAAAPFSISFHGVFEQEGERLSDVQAEGYFAGATTYEVTATFRLIDQVNVHRVIRIGDRQWEWSEAEAGWRATLPGADVVSQSIAGLLSSLAEAQDVVEVDSRVLADAECRGYRFKVPVGAAVVQGLVVEGDGTLWVRPTDGLPVQLDFSVSTPIGATGTATVVIFDHGLRREIVPPGLGGTMADDGAAFQSSALASSMEGRNVVHWTLEASGEGPAVTAGILPSGAVLDVYVLPHRPGAVARLRAGDRVLGQMIADRDLMCEYFLSSGSDEVPRWSCRRIDPAAPDAPWRLHTQVISQAIGDSPLIPDGPIPAEGMGGEQLYRFELAEGSAAGLFLPLVREELVAGEAEVSGSVRLGGALGELRSIELTIRGQTAGRETLTATERYRFSYELSEQERAEIEEAFEEARQIAAAQDESRLVRAREVAGLVEQVARECVWALGDRDALRVKLGRLERAEGVLAAWVLGPDGVVFAAVGADSDHPPAIEALGSHSAGSPANAREVGDGDPRLMVAPILNREGVPEGCVVARWTAQGAQPVR